MNTGDLVQEGDLVRNSGDPRWQMFSGIVGDWCGVVLEFRKSNLHPLPQNTRYYLLKVLLSSHGNVVESLITEDEFREHVEVIT